MTHTTRRFRRASHLRAPSFNSQLYPANIALRPSAVAVAVALLGVHGAASGGPTGGEVTAGAATINQSGAVTTINQSTHRAALNWQSFSIGAAESVIFRQPSSSAVALNRVIGPNPSEIYGALQANGHVFLVNPAGVLFSRGANVDVAGLVASTLNITNNDFMSGRYVFSGGAGSGAVANHANIRVPNGSYVALLGNQVTNTGTIVASNGSVALGAGESMVLDFNGDGLLSLKVNAAAAKAKIEHSGSIQADGGAVIMSAQAKNALLDTVLNVEGLVQAKGIVERGGHIYLDGGRSGVTRVSGTLDASSAQAKGGDVRVLGENVGLFGAATIDASGDKGGGTVLVGGDFQGKNPEVANARATYVGPGATIRADAITHGDGGKVIVWADETTKYYGAASARGGASGGNGGFAEVSGKRFLDFAGRVDLRSPRGQTGTLLLDPEDIDIVDGGDQGMTVTDIDQNAGPPYLFTSNESSAGPAVLNDGTINARLATANVVVATGGAGAGSGRIRFQTGPIAFDAGGTANNLTFNAHGSIEVIASTSYANGSGTLTLSAGGGGAGNISVDSPLSSSGNIVLSAVGAIDVNAAVAAPGRNVTITAGDTLTVGAAISTRGADSLGIVTAGGAGGQIFLHRTNAVAGKAITITSAGSLEASGGDASEGGDTSGNGGTVTIYNADGNIAIDGNIFAREGLPFAAGASGAGGLVQLKTNGGGTITQAATGSRIATTRGVVASLPGRLLVDSAGAVDLTGNGSNYVGTVAGRTRDPGASFSYRDGWPFTVGTITPAGAAVATAGLIQLSGITTADANTTATPGVPAESGSIMLETVAGSITIANTVRTGDAIGLAGSGTARSGSITVTAGGSGQIIGHLTATSFATGGARFDPDPFFGGPFEGEQAIVGNMTLSASGISAPGSAPVIIEFGVPGTVGPSDETRVRGVLEATSRGAGPDGDIRLLSSATQLITGPVTATGAGASIEIGTTGAGNSLTIGGPVTTAANPGGASGSISLTTAAADIGILDQVKTGDSVVAGTGGSDAATSGSLTITAGGGGAISSIGTLITGDAAVTGADASDLAFVGTIQLSGSRVGGEFGSSPIPVRLGTANAGPGTIGVGTLSVMTSGAGAFNDSAVTSDRPLWIAASSATGPGASLSFSTTGASPLTVVGPISTADNSNGNSGSITLSTTAANIFIDNTITTGGATINGFASDAVSGSITVSAGGNGAIGTNGSGSLATGAASVANIGGFGDSAIAVSGDITLSAGGQVGGALTLTTGNASGDDGGEAADTVSARSGAISVTAAGANLMLGALRTGNSTVTNAGPATSTSGGVTLAGGSIGTSAAARQLVSIGTATTGADGTSVNGVLVTTATTGDTFITSDVPLTTAALIATGAGKAIDIETTGGSNPLTFAGSVATNNGALKLSAAGDLVVDAAIDGTGSGSVNLTGANIRLNADVTTSGGAVVFNNQVSLGGDRTVSAGSGAISFLGAVDSNTGFNFSLTANSTGDTTFDGAVGNNMPLSALTTNAGGRTLIGGGFVTTAGAQTYNDAVQVTADTTFDAGGSTGLTFEKTLDGAFAVTLPTSGDTTFGGAVGGNTPLASLSTPSFSGQAVNINGGLVATSGDQTYGGGAYFQEDITLGAPAELRSQSGTITFGGSFFVSGGRGLAAGPHDLTITANNIVFDGGNDSIRGTGKITLQPFSPTVPVTLGNDGTNNTAQFAGAPFNLDALEQGFSMITIGRADATAPTTVQDVEFRDPVTIRGGATTGPAPLFGIFIDGELANTGDGASVTLTPTAGTGILFSDSIVTNNGAVTLNAPVVLGTSFFGDPQIDTIGTVPGCGCGTDAPGANVTFASTIDADGPAAGRTLNIFAEQGTVTFSGDIGATAPLAGLLVSAGSIVFNAPSTALATPGAQLLNVSDPTPAFGAGALLFGPELVDQAAQVSLVQNLRIEAGGNPIFFGDPVFGLKASVQGPGSLVANSTAAFDFPFPLGVHTPFATYFSGPVGDVTPLASLTIGPGGDTVIDGGSVSTVGAQTYGGPVFLGSHTTFTGTNGTFGGGITGTLGGGTDPVDLTLSFSGATALSGATNIRDLLSNGGGTTLLSGMFATTGMQTYADAVTLAAPTTLESSGGGAIGFNGTLDGGQALEINTAGATTFGGAVGGMAPLGSLTTDAPGTTLFTGGGVTTSGGQAYNDPVTLGAAFTFTSSGGPIAFNNTLDGAFGLTVNTGGMTTFGGIVGGTTPLASLTTDAPGTTAINTTAINTTGSQTYGDAVVLGANAALNSTAGGVSFGGALDADLAANLRTLVVNAPTGTVTFSGNVGANQALADLDVTSGPNTTIFNAATGQTINVNAGGGNTLTFTGNVLLNQNVTFNTDGASDNSIVFNSGINSGAGANQTLNIVAGSGNLLLNGVGGSGPLGGLNVAANQVTLNGNIALNGGGSFNFNNVTAVLLAPNVLIVMDAPGGSTGAGAITFNPATTINSAGTRSTLTLNPLADGGGADSLITMGTLGPSVTLVVLTRPLTTAGTGIDSVLRSALDELQETTEDLEEDRRRRLLRAAQAAAAGSAAAPPATCTPKAGTLSCD